MICAADDYFYFFVFKTILSSKKLSFMGSFLVFQVGVFFFTRVHDERWTKEDEMDKNSKVKEAYYTINPDKNHP